MFGFSENNTSDLYFASQVTASWFKDVLDICIGNQDKNTEEDLMGWLHECKTFCFNLRLFYFVEEWIKTLIKKNNNLRFIYLVLHFYFGLWNVS